MIWNDEYFPFCSDESQLVFFHMMTTPMRSPFGLYKASIEALAAEKRWTVEGYRKAFAEAFEKGFVKYDERHQVIYLPRYLPFNPPNNPNVVKRWGKVFEEIPNCPLKWECHEALKAFCEGLSKAFMEAFNEAFPKASSKGMAIQEQEQEQEEAKAAGTAAPFQDENRHFCQHVGEWREKLLSVLKCFGNGRSSKFNAYAFVQQKVNEGHAHPIALIKILEQLDGQWSKIQNPWGWLESRFEVENQNCHERDFQNEAVRFREEWGRWSSSDDAREVLIALKIRAP